MLYKCDEGTVFGEIQAMDLSSEGCCTSYLRELYFLMLADQGLRCLSEAPAKRYKLCGLSVLGLHPFFLT